MRRILQHLVRVWPPWGIVAGLLLILLVGTSTSAGLAAGLGGISLSGAILYGSYRCSAFHPHLRGNYGRWLATTPWDHRRSLPLGPVHFVFWDAIVLTLMVVLIWPVHQPLLQIVVVLALFLLGYFVSLAFHLKAKIDLELTVVGALCWGLALRVGLHPMLALPLLLVSYGLILWGVRRRLAEGLPTAMEARKALKATSLGFPFSSHSPRWSVFDAPVLTWVLICVLISQVIYNAAAIPFIAQDLTWQMSGDSGFAREEVLPLEQAAGPADDLAILLHGLVVAAAVLGYLVNYGARYWPSMNVLGRLATRQLVIPDYDRIWLAPLMAIGVALAFPSLGTQFGMATRHAAPVATFFSLLMLRSVGPRFREWQLTGAHRMIALERLDSNRYVKTT